MLFVLDETISFGFNGRQIEERIEAFISCCCKTKCISMIELRDYKKYLLDAYGNKMQFCLSFEWQELKESGILKKDLSPEIVIRIFCGKEEIDEAISYIQSAPQANYKFSLCPKYISNFNDVEIISLAEKVNNTSLTTLYICENLFSFSSNNLMRSFLLFDHHLKDNIKIGLHFEIPFSFGIDKIEKLCDIVHKRDVIIDTTMLGICGEKGSINTELLLDTMNFEYEETALIDSMEIIWSLVKPALPWGYSPLSFLEAKTRTNSEYFEYFLTKGLHLSEMKDIVNLIDDNYFRYEFDKNYADKLLNDWKNKAN